MEKICHRLAVAVFDQKDDPIAVFSEQDSAKLNSALNLPRQGFGGQELYPTLIEKAAILYYVLNKTHAFRNGNKRISAASLLVFLYINDMWLDTDKLEIVKKTLEVANSEAAKKDEIVANIKEWIQTHIIPINKFK